jgi:gliding motility-associated-like protein
MPSPAIPGGHQLPLGPEWLPGCSEPSDIPSCWQTLTIRDLITGNTRWLITRGTTSLDLSGGYLALDAAPNTPGPPSTRQLRVVRLATGEVAMVGSLPAIPHTGSTWDAPYYAGPPRHFDIDDETIAWVDAQETAKVAPLTPFVEAPIYLGNVIAPASFSPNGDRQADVWPMAFPVSKALPNCTVTFYRGSTAVRILNCANSNGMATVAWNGRSGSGARLPTGRYWYRVNGRNGDGWLRNSDLRLIPITGTINKTA